MPAPLAPSLGSTRHREHLGLTTRLSLGAQVPSWSALSCPPCRHPEFVRCLTPRVSSCTRPEEKGRHVHSTLAKQKSPQMVSTVWIGFSHHQDGSRVKQQREPLTDHPSPVQRVLCRRRAWRALGGPVDGAVLRPLCSQAGRAPAQLPGRPSASGLHRERGCSVGVRPGRHPSAASPGRAASALVPRGGKPEATALLVQSQREGIFRFPLPRLQLSPSNLVSFWSPCRKRRRVDFTADKHMPEECT